MLPPVEFSAPHSLLGFAPYCLFLALAVCDQKEGAVPPGELIELVTLSRTEVPADGPEESHSTQAARAELSPTSLGFSRPAVLHQLAAADPSAIPRPERVVFNLRSSQPMAHGVVRLRRALDPGERVEMRVGAGSAMTVVSTPLDHGRLRLQLEYVSTQSGTSASREVVFVLPGEISWTPAQGGPTFDLRVRRHRRIKLILDGDPLSWFSGQPRVDRS